MHLSDSDLRLLGTHSRTTNDVPNAYKHFREIHYCLGIAFKNTLFFVYYGRYLMHVLTP